MVAGWAARKMFNIVIILADICRPQIGDRGETGKYLRGEHKYMCHLNGIFHQSVGGGDQVHTYVLTT